MTAAPWPTELRLSEDRKMLSITFDNGDHFDITAELLRVSSPSAEVQGHSPSQRKTVGGKRAVEILSVDGVGNYAVRLGFSDMHSTGIYSWAFLHDLGKHAAERFAIYETELAAKRLNRDMPGAA